MHLPRLVSRNTMRARDFIGKAARMHDEILVHGHSKQLIRATRVRSWSREQSMMTAVRVRNE